MQRSSLSSLVTISTSPASIRATSLDKPSCWAIAVLPDIVSVMIRCFSTWKPAALISVSWFSVVCPVVETRTYANVRDLRLQESRLFEIRYGSGTRYLLQMIQNGKSRGGLFALLNQLAGLWAV